MKRIQKLRQHFIVGTLVVAGALINAAMATATQLIVKVSGANEPAGQIACSLFAGASGFPMDGAKGRSVWLQPEGKTAECRFEDVPAGSYAVSVAHDKNRNRKVDTNFLGIPTEQWGVSNNVRPRLRAPRYDEAVFKIPENAVEFTIDIKLDN